MDRQLNLGGTFVCDTGAADRRPRRLRRVHRHRGVRRSSTKTCPGIRSGARRVRASSTRRHSSRSLEPLGFNNTFTILVRGEGCPGARPADDRGPASAGARWTPGFGHEFLQRQDGYPGLVAAYGLQFKSQPRGMELSLIYRALADGQVDVIAGDATSALIDSLDLAPLEDTRHYFPPYDAVPVVRAASLRREPGLSRALQRLAGKVTDQDMRALNAAVDLEKTRRPRGRPGVLRGPGPLRGLAPISQVLRGQGIRRTDLRRNEGDVVAARRTELYSAPMRQDNLANSPGSTRRLPRHLHHHPHAGADRCQRLVVRLVQDRPGGRHRPPAVGHRRRRRSRGASTPRSRCSSRSWASPTWVTRSSA